MTEERYNKLNNSCSDLELTQSEIEEGWHFCNEFDGLLVGPNMTELLVCTCLNPEHKVYQSKPPEINFNVFDDKDLQ